MIPENSFLKRLVSEEASFLEVWLFGKHSIWKSDISGESNLLEKLVSQKSLFMGARLPGNYSLSLLEIWEVSGKASFPKSVTDKITLFAYRGVVVI